MTDVLFQFLRESLKEGRKIEIRGFGTFEVKHYGERKSFNPKTRSYIDLSARDVPFYKASSVLKRSVNKHLSSHELD